jgi:TolA-binding protein
MNMLKPRNYSSFVRPWVSGLRYAWVLCVAVPLIAAAPADPASTLEQLTQIRLKQIPLLEDFVEKYPQSPRRADTLFRLGEAYFETAKYYELKGDREGSASRQLRAIQVLESLRQQHPDYAQLDKALFVLANALIEKKMLTQAGAVLATLAERYPDSPVVQQASMLLGDHYFSEKAFARAESYYLKALEDEKMKSYVHYKLAWTAVNQAQPAKALQYFEKVLGSAGGGQDYSRDAVREMVWPALSVYGASRVGDYLASTIKDPALVESALARLADGLMERNEPQSAILLYERLRSTFPQSDNQYAYLTSQIKAEEALGRHDKIKQLVAVAAQTVDANNPAAMEQLFQSAKKFHAEGQKATAAEPKAKAYDLAISYYQAYLSRAAATEPKRLEASFYLGEALFGRSQYALARQTYREAAQSESPFQGQAAWNWYLAAEKTADGFMYKGKEPQTPSEGDQAFLEASRFLQSVASVSLDQKRRASYQSARLLYQLHDYDRSLPVFKSLAENFATSEEGKMSAQLVLDIYNLRKDYDQVAAYARQLSGQTQSAQKNELKSIEQKAALKAIQERERAAKAQSGSQRMSELERVGQDYLTYAKTYPSAPLVDAALWAAFQNLTEVALEQRQGLRPDMREAFDKLQTQYPQSKYTPQSVHLMGRFLAARRLPSDELLAFKKFRPEWVKLMRQVPLEERGAFALLNYRLSDESQMNSLFKSVGQLPMNDVNREFIALGRLRELRAEVQAFEKVSLKSLKTLQKNTTKKLKLLGELEKATTELAQLKVAETTVAGLHLLAEAFLHMGKAIRQSPVPGQLSGENREKYLAAVSQKAVEFETKGQEARRLAEKTAQETNLSGT